MRAASAVIIASPGYHGSISGVVKNALDLLEERMKGHQGAGRHRLVPHSITVRESAPAAAP